MWLVNKLGGGAQAQLQGDQPYISAPLIAAAQEVHVAPIGSEPEVIGAGEDMRLFDESLCSRWSGELRAGLWGVRKGVIREGALGSGGLL